MSKPSVLFSSPLRVDDSLVTFLLGQGYPVTRVTHPTADDLARVNPQVCVIAVESLNNASAPLAQAAHDAKVPLVVFGDASRHYRHTLPASIAEAVASHQRASFNPASAQSAEARAHPIAR